MVGQKFATKLALLSVLTAVACLPLVSAAEESTNTPVHGHINTGAHPEARVTKKVDESKREVLYGHVSGAVRRATDLGRLDPSTPAEHMVMVLKSSGDQERELRRVLDEQQDSKTENYHQWIAPEDFGSYFGVHDADIAQITKWLASHGLKVEDVSKSKRVLHFSGTTGQLEEAFQTQIHSYMLNGERHVSNNSEISVPSALSQVIAGVPMHNFFAKSRMTPIKKVSGRKIGPHLYGGPCTGTAESTCDAYVGPADFATIFNTQPLLNAGINGTGSSIAIVGRSDILMSDVQDYRAMFGLVDNDPIFVHAGQDNGIVPGDDGESDLDVELSGGYAPNAKLYFVIGTPTFFVDGISNSMQYIVENNLADIMSSSYGDCESNEGVGGNEFNNQLFEQAAAQGISVFIAAGDNGPAECDDQNDNYENLGYSTGAEASTPYSVAVGGTAFYEGANATSNSIYWSSTNPADFGTALSYIPEIPWNGSANSDLTDDPSDTLSGLWSGSGGISSYYTQPSWQRGSGVYSTDPTLTQGGDWVQSVTISNGGKGYTTAPSVTFGSGCLTTPKATTTISGGAVTGVVFNYGTQGGTLAAGEGFGCTTAPTVTFGAAPSGGTTAAGTAVIGPMWNILPLIQGVPHRYTPDLVLAAEVEHDGNVFCSEGTCENTSPGNWEFAIVGGTSVAAPSMAGVQALINQANGGRQGAPNYMYYALSAAQSEAGCNSTMGGSIGSSCAFHDVTTGDNYICGESTCKTQAAKIGFPAASGYDLATGLGSPNAANLASQWKSVVFHSSNTTLGLSKTSGIAQGASVTLSGTVAAGSGGGTPTGDVAFILSKGAFGETINIDSGAFNGPGAFATLSGGSYSATLNNLPAGTYTITARYGGDTTYASSLSAPVTVTVGSGTATVTLTPEYFADQTTCEASYVSSYSYGQFAWIPAAVTASAGSSVPTGTVTFTVDGVPYTTVSLDEQGNGYLAAGTIGINSSGSIYSCVYDYMYAQAPTLLGGIHTIGASYSGDSTFAATTATPVQVTVNPLSINPVLTVGANTISSGFADPLTATFTVTALSGAQNVGSGPTGTVTFKDGSVVLGTSTVTPTVLYEVGAGSSSTIYPSYTFGATSRLVTTAITNSGSNSITAVYSGDSNYAATTSTAVTVTVDTPTYTTTTTVTSSANPTTIGGRPTLTATIAASGGTAPATGTVTFYDGTTSMGTGTYSSSSKTWTLKLSATYPLTGGLHSITAVYGGIAADGPSTSAPFGLTVNKGAGTIVLTAGNASVYGQNLTLSAVLTPSPTGSTAEVYPLTGSVQFYDGATLIGTATPGIVAYYQGGYGVWTAPMATATLGAGTHNITATYTDANYTFTTSNTQALALAKAPLTVTDNQSMNQGSAVPTLVPTYSGFVNGDTTAVLSGAPSLSTPATSSSPAGVYPIAVGVGSLTAANYSFNTVNGTMSVISTPAITLTVSATIGGSASGGYTAMVKVTNTSTGNASDVTLTTGTLGSSSATSGIPNSIGSLGAGISKTVLVSFPGTAGADGAASVYKFAGTYTGGTFSGSARVTLP